MREKVRRQESIKEVARRAIAKCVADRTQRRDAHLRAIVAEDANLLGRLGSV